MLWYNVWCEVITLHVTDTLCYHQVSFMWGGEEKHTATLLNRDTGWEQFQLAFELFYEVMTYSFERFKWKLEHDPIKCLQKLLAYAKRWRDTSRNDIRVKTSVRKSHGTGCESSLESDPPLHDSSWEWDTMEALDKFSSHPFASL